MARPTVANVESAVTDLFNAVSSGNFKYRSPRARAAVAALQEVAAVAVEAYKPNVTVTVSGADLAAFYATSAGALYTAKGGVVEVGDVFEVTDSSDTTDTALATAEGSAPAAGDRFEVTGVSGSEAVSFLGAADPDFSAEEVADFTGQP